jgi:hypothetical protein
MQPRHSTYTCMQPVRMYMHAAMCQQSKYMYVHACSHMPTVQVHDTIHVHACSQQFKYKTVQYMYMHCSHAPTDCQGTRHVHARSQQGTKCGVRWHEYSTAWTLKHMNCKQTLWLTVSQSVSSWSWLLLSWIQPHPEIEYYQGHIHCIQFHMYMVCHQYAQCYLCWQLHTTMMVSTATGCHRISSRVHRVQTNQESAQLATSTQPNASCQD